MSPPSEQRRFFEEDPFVGRDAEFAVVADLAARAREGAGASVFLSGKPGIGKTRFLAECTRRARNDAIVASARCANRATGSPPLARQLGAALWSSARQQLDAASILRKLNDVTTRNLVLCLIDDLEHAGPDDLAFVSMLDGLSRVRKLIAVAAYAPVRGQPPPAIAATVQQCIHDGARTISLSPLAPNEAEILVRCAAPHLGEAARARIIAGSAGNPRYVRELTLESALGTDELIPRSAAAQAAAMRAAFSKQAMALLVVASISPSAFDERWLAVLMNRGPGTVTAALQEVVDGDVLVQISEDPPLFAFTDVIVARALYLSLITSKRKALHGALASVLVAERTDGRYDELIAHQWLAAGEGQQAITWAETAGEAMEAAQRFAEALDLYFAARELHEVGSTEWIDMHCRVIRCHQYLGNHQETIPLRQQVFELHMRRGDPAKAADDLHGLMFDYYTNGDIASSEASFERLRALPVPEIPDLPALAAVSWAQLLAEMGRKGEAARYLRSVRRRDCTSLQTIARRAMVSGILLGNRGRLAPALAQLEQARQAAHRAGLERGVTECLAVAAMIAAHAGSSATANRLLIEALASAERHSPDDEQTLHAHLAAAEISVVEGRFENAAAHVRSLLAVRYSGWQWSARAYGLGVFVGLRLGNAGWVRALFEPELLEPGIRMRSAEACGILARAYSFVFQERGVTKQWVAMLQQCLEAEIIDSNYWIPLSAVLTGPPEQLRDARLLIARDTGGASPVVGAALNLFDACAARRSGNLRQAAKAACAAAHAYRSLGRPWMEAMAHETGGALDEARALYERCGAVRDVARVSVASSARQRRAPFGSALTAREQQVVRLALEGLRDREIAIRLGIGERTVGHHLEATYNKLGIRARWQLNDAIAHGEALTALMATRRG